VHVPLSLCKQVLSFKDAVDNAWRQDGARTAGVETQHEQGKRIVGPWLQNAIITVFPAILVAVGTIMLVQLIAEESYPNLLHMGEGLWIGLLVGLAYLLAEILSHQSIKIWLYNAFGIKQGGGYFVWSEGELICI
jgi:hypothetical protein